MTFQMPQHMVDQQAAAMRETGMPAPVARIAVACMVCSLNTLAEGFTVMDAAGIPVDAAEAADFARSLASAWQQVLDTM